MSTSQDLLIMEPFNKVFWVTFSAFLLLLVVATLLLRKKSEKTRRTVLVAAC